MTHGQLYIINEDLKWTQQILTLDILT